MNGDDIVDKAVRQIILNAVGGKISDYDYLVYNEDYDTYDSENDTEKTRRTVKGIREHTNYTHKY